MFLREDKVELRCSFRWFQRCRAGLEQCGLRLVEDVSTRSCFPAVSLDLFEFRRRARSPDTTNVLCSSSTASIRATSPSARAIRSRTAAVCCSMNRAVLSSSSAPRRYSSTFKSLSNAFFRSAGGFEKYRGECSLRNADRPAKERVEIRSRLDAEVLPEKSRDLFLLVRDPDLQRRIVDVVTGRRIAIDRVVPLVEAALESHADRPLFAPRRRKSSFL